MNRDEYVRCRYCDSKLQPEKVTSLPKKKRRGRELEQEERR